MRHTLRSCSSALVTACVMTAVASGQLNIIHQEGFNTDGDGDRYMMTGRGADPLGAEGPGAWEHSFLVEAIGLPSKAPAKRAAILWGDVATEDDVTEASLQVWDNLVNFMIDGKENATIGFLPGITASPWADFLSFRLEDEFGHTPVDVASDLPDPADVDLVIHTAGGNPNPITAFSSYEVPVITYNGGAHDDSLISSIGSPTTGGPTMVTVLDVEHPVLEGVTKGDVPWVDDFIAEEPLQGIGGAQPAGATTLATYVDPATELVLPAILLVDEGADLLGAFAPVPEGEGFIIGGDLNLDFGSGTAASAEDPVTLTLNPVDVSSESEVKLSVDLAATTVDFEPVDFVRVSYAPDENSEFVVLGAFHGLDDPSSVSNKSLVDPNLGPLNADEFTTFTFDIPDEATDLIVKFEAFSTFANEVLGIDNVVIFNGEPLPPAPDLAGDADGDGDVDFDDFVALSNSFGQNVDPNTGADFSGNGVIDFDDFVALSNNFGATGGGAAQVPEPSGLVLLSFALVSLAWRRRR